MTRSTLSLLLVWVLSIQAVPASAQKTAALRERFQKTPLGTEIEVKLTSGEVVTGQLARVAESFLVVLVFPPENKTDSNRSPATCFALP